MYHKRDKEKDAEIFILGGEKTKMVYGEIDGKKIVRVIRVFEDGSEQYLEGVSLENFFIFEKAANAIAVT